MLTPCQRYGLLAVRIGCTLKHAEILTRLAEVEFVPMEALSERLGTQPNTVRVHMNNLRTRGWKIGHRTNVGYFLDSAQRAEIKAVMAKDVA